MATYNVSGNVISRAGAIAKLTEYGNIDTAANFASAFAAAVADSAIDGVEIPSGTYIIATPLVLRSNFGVFGNGCTIIMSAQVNTFVFTNVHDCVIDGININMAQTKATTAGTALYITDSSRIICRNMRIYNIGIRACLAMPTDKTSSGSVEYLVFDGITMEGIGEANTMQPEWPCGIIAVNAKHSTIRNCVVSGMSRFTLEFKNYSADSSMIDNTIVGGETGLAIGGDRPATETLLAKAIVFSGNRVSGCKYPLYFGRSKNLNVFGNVLAGESIWVENCDRCMFSDNIIEGDTASSNALLDIRNGNYTIIQNNRYEKGESANLYNIQSSTNTIISGYYNGKWFSAEDPVSGTPA